MSSFNLYPVAHLIPGITSTVEAPGQQIQITSTPGSSSSSDISHDVVKIFSDNGQLGFVILCIFLGAYLLDLQGFLRDIRSGFKNLGKLADGIEILATDMERYQKRSDTNTENLQQSMNHFVTKIEENANKLDRLNNKVDQLLLKRG